MNLAVIDVTIGYVAYVTSYTECRFLNRCLAMVQQSSGRFRHHYIRLRPVIDNALWRLCEDCVNIIIPWRRNRSKIKHYIVFLL